MTTPVYRRPTEYIPPYNYCDRWCARCRIDKTKCEVYQRETNDRLHHEIDGVDPDDTDVVIADVKKNFDEALLMLREKAKELGIDLDKVEDAPEPAPTPRPRKRDPLFERAREIAAGVGAFLRDHRAELAKEFKAQHEVLAWHYLQVGAKIGRAMFRDDGERDEYEEAADILTAQIAHLGLSRMLAAIQEICAVRTAWRDETLSTLSAMQKLMKEIEKRWLSKKSALLEPVKGNRWWGPLRTAPILRRKRK